MRFPFISRERHEEIIRLHQDQYRDAINRILQLEQEVGDLRMERRLHLDRIVWGYSNRELYPDTPRIIPPTPDEPEPKKEAGEEQVQGLVEQVVSEVGGKARAVKMAIQAKHDKAYQDKVDQLFKSAIAEGKAMAKTPEVTQ